MAKRKNTAQEAIDAIPQPRELKKIDALKKKLLGTDRDDHWQIAVDMEREIKVELLKHDLAEHQGFKLLLDWMIRQVSDTNALLSMARSKDLSDAQRDGLIERSDFIKAMVRFLDPKGKRLRDLEKELDFQLEDDDVDNDEEDTVE